MRKELSVYGANLGETCEVHTDDFLLSESSDDPAVIEGIFAS